MKKELLKVVQKSAKDSSDDALRVLVGLLTNLNHEAEPDADKASSPVFRFITELLSVFATELGIRAMKQTAAGNVATPTSGSGKPEKKK